MERSDVEKIFFKKIKSVSKLKKDIKIDKQEMFYSKIFNLLYSINNLVTEDFEFSIDPPIVRFSINLYTNVGLVLHSNRLSGYNYGIGAFTRDKRNNKFVEYEDSFYEIENIEKLKLYFNQKYSTLPFSIKITELNILCHSQNMVLEYNFKD